MDGWMARMVLDWCRPRVGCRWKCVFIFRPQPKQISQWPRPDLHPDTICWLSGANRWDNKGKYKTDNISFQETSIAFKEAKTRLICERSLVNVCLSPDWSWVSTHFPSSYKKRMAVAVKTEEDIQCSSSHYFHFSLKVYSGLYIGSCSHLLQAELAHCHLKLMQLVSQLS